MQAMKRSLTALLAAILGAMAVADLVLGPALVQLGIFEPFQGFRIFLAGGLLGGGKNAFILKSGAESAIVAGRAALARCHGGLITLEQPPKGEHQSNGTAEEAGRALRDQAGVLKIHLQAHIGRGMRTGELIMPWLIRWAAMPLCRFSQGKDGRTPYEREREDL